MSYQSWRITFQDSEQAAKAAYKAWHDAMDLLEAQEKLHRKEKEHESAQSSSSPEYLGGDQPGDF